MIKHPYERKVTITLTAAYTSEQLDKAFAQAAQMIGHAPAC
jgi:hypothetical protein